MNAERLFEAITNLSDTLVEEATVCPARNRWKRYTALAAAAALVIGLGAAGLHSLRLGTAQAGGAGSEDGTTFMSYAGPVFPLSLAEENDQITAERALTLDFAPWQGTWISNEAQRKEAEENGMAPDALQSYAEELAELYPEGGYQQSSRDLQVTDAYTLTNHAAEDQTILVRYPFAASAQYLAARTPTLTLDGAAIETTLYAGVYSGGFQDAIGSDTGARLNLLEPDNWQVYEQLLQSGGYEETAFAPTQDLHGIPVIVYEITDISGPEKTKKMPNPTLAVEFNMDYDKTQVLTYEFNGGRFDQEQGTQQVSCSVPQQNGSVSQKPRTHYVLVLGEDVQNLTIQGYHDGGCDPGKEIDGVTANVRRYESDLGTILHTVLQQWRAAYGQSDDLAAPVSEELQERLFLELFTNYGSGSDDPAERYEGGNLDLLIGECLTLERVFYLQAEITIPAGGSVTLTTEQNKAASFDYFCAHTENRGIYGYDLVTQLGSRLQFTSRRVTLEDRGFVEIIRQNFGFSETQKTVTLDPAVAHYYLEVREKEK